MKSLLIPVAWFAAGVLCLADAKDDVKAAAKKLADAPSYTWVSTSEMDGGNFGPTSITGKMIKGEYTVITSERDGNVTTAVRKGEKGVVKTDEGWKTAEDLRGGGGGGGGGGRGMRGAMLLRSRAPGDDVLATVDKTKELKAADGVISGDLTEEGAKELMAFGPRRGAGGGGGQGPETKNAKGSVKYWIKDGQLTKIQTRVTGTMTFNNEDRDIGRTTTYEIKDVGTTKVEVPEDAKKALGS